MRTQNTYYISKNDFNIFIQKNSFADEKSLLVQIFSSTLEQKILEKIIEDVISLLPNAKIIGATTDGEILNNKVTTNQTVVSVTAFEKATLQVAMQKNHDNSYFCGKKLAQKLVQKDTKALFLFSDGLHTNGEVFLNGIKEFSQDIPLAGGMAGDAAHFKETFVLSNEGIISSGAVGVSVNSDELYVNTSYNFNWKEIGKALKVTKAQDNRVYEIDNIPAVEVYSKYLGEDIAESLPAVGVEFPLIINRDGLKIARAVLGKSSDGSLVFAGNIAVGDDVHFGYGNSSMILNESMHVKDKYINAPVEAIFIYSCMARRRFLEDAICLELTPLANIAPTAGFFTYGEFYKSDKCELLNQTMTVISMSESADTQDFKNEYHFKNKIDGSQLAKVSKTQKALSHLVEETSRELKETNDNLEKLVAHKTEELQKKVEELEHASVVKSEFLASMSHEIRTPLNAMLGFVDILRATETDKERLKRFSIIKNSGASLLTIINDILDFSKVESGKMVLEQRKFATKKPFKEIGHLFYDKAVENGIDLKLEFKENLPRFFVGDIVRIKQVVANLLSNAIKFTPKGGHITVYIEYNAQREELHFSVSDDGVGIAQQNLKKIFDSFTQEDASTTRNFGGTGLGLSISSALIHSMGGRISVESVLGEGSRFEFFLPLVKAESIDLVEDSFVDKIDLNKSLNGQVLLVEDNQTNQMLMNIVLGDLDLDVDLAQNGLEAVEKFKENRYDLILMDENMPKMNGIEATRIILDLEQQENLKHTPIVALTANALATDRERFLNAGMDEFVSKPIDHELFVRVLQTFLL